MNFELSIGTVVSASPHYQYSYQQYPTQRLAVTKVRSEAKAQKNEQSARSLHDASRSINHRRKGREKYARSLLHDFRTS